MYKNKKISQLVKKILIIEICSGGILQLKLKADVFNRLSLNFVNTFSLDDNACFDDLYSDIDLKEH
ncbi:UNVERIFIED_CONTAM: hypothetical protein NCL1_47531 [Trichonephila clavipes]